MFDNSNMNVDFESNLDAAKQNQWLRASTPLEFGERFRAERKALGKTLEDLATAVGCRRQTIADIEAGKNVGLMTVFMALGALGKCIEIKSTRYEFGDMLNWMDDNVEG